MVLSLLSVQTGGGDRQVSVRGGGFTFSVSCRFRRINGGRGLMVAIRLLDEKFLNLNLVSAECHIEFWGNDLKTSFSYIT